MTAQLQEERSGIAEPNSRPPSMRAERIRVLHVIPQLGLGGTEKGVLKVIAGLGSDKYEHRICAVRGIDAGFASGELSCGNAYSADSGKPGFQFPLWRLKKFMQEFRPHVMHSRNFGALEAIPAARLAHVPVAIHSEHGYELEIMGGLPLRRQMLCRVFYQMADAVFTVTKDLRTYHAAQTRLSPERFQVLYNGVDTVKFSPDRELAVQIRSTLGVPPGRLLIGSVGRLVPIKDHKTLLRAAEVLVQQGKDVHVLIAGAGPELANLKSFADASSSLAGRVLFTGAANNVPELLHAMDAFVLPSICEGMSNTILEAMSCGVPVIVTRTGGNPELIEEGCSGYLFAPGDAPALSRLLSQIAEHPAEARELGAAARLRAVEEFSISGMIGKYHRMYQDLLLRKLVKGKN